MLLLLLRLLTSPAPAVPVVAVADKVVEPQPRPSSAAVADARARMASIEAGPGRIRMLMRNAQDTQFHASCVAHRLAEAQVHVTLARDEMQRLGLTPSQPGAQPVRVSDGDRAHALKRLTLLAERTAEVEKAARICIEDELSTISATKFEVEVTPAVKAVGDVTEPASPPLLPDLRPPKP
jgi:hypothetical protein